MSNSEQSHNKRQWNGSIRLSCIHRSGNWFHGVSEKARMAWVASTNLAEPEFGALGSLDLDSLPLGTCRWSLDCYKLLIIYNFFLTEPLVRHPDFHLFACMNPATDVGKRNLPPGIRNRWGAMPGSWRLYKKFSFLLIGNINITNLITVLEISWPLIEESFLSYSYLL